MVTITSSAHAAHVSRHRPGTLIDISSDFMPYVGTRISAAGGRLPARGKRRPSDGRFTMEHSRSGRVVSRRERPYRTAPAAEYFATKGANTNVEEAGTTRPSRWMRRCASDGGAGPRGPVALRGRRAGGGRKPTVRSVAGESTSTGLSITEL